MIKKILLNILAYGFFPSYFIFLWYVSSQRVSEWLFLVVSFTWCFIWTALIYNDQKKKQTGLPVILSCIFDRITKK